MKCSTILTQIILATFAVLLAPPCAFTAYCYNPMTSSLNGGGYTISNVNDIITTGPWIDVRSYASFSAAITAIGSSEKTLLIPNSQTVSANVTVPANVNLLFLKGGLLNISTGVTVTIQGTIAADPFKIFTLNGTAAIDLFDAAIKEVYPEWWGAKGDDSTNDYSAISAAIATGKAVQFQDKIYQFGSTLSVGNGGTLRGAGGILGYHTILKPTSTVTVAAITLNSGTTIDNIQLDGTLTTSAVTGILAGNSVTSRCVLNKVTIRYFGVSGSVGLHINDVVGCYVYDAYIEDNAIGVQVYCSNPALPTCVTFYGGRITGSYTKNLYIVSGYNLNFYGTDFESSTEEGVYISPVAGKEVNKVRFQDCWFEDNYHTDSNQYQFYTDNWADGIKIDNCIFNYNSDPCDPHSKAKACHFNGVYNLIIDGGMLRPNTKADSVKIEGTNSSGWIMNLPSSTDFVSKSGTYVRDLTEELNSLKTAWTTWTPTYRTYGNITFTNGTATCARYKVIGKTAFVELNFSGTIGTGGDGCICIYLPSGLVPKASMNLYTPAVIWDSAPAIGYVRSADTDGLYFYKIGNWTSGTGRGGSVCLTFEIQ